MCYWFWLFAIGLLSCFSGLVLLFDCCDLIFWLCFVGLFVCLVFCVWLCLRICGLFVIRLVEWFVGCSETLVVSGYIVRYVWCLMFGLLICCCVGCLFGELLWLWWLVCFLLFLGNLVCFCGVAGMNVGYGYVGLFEYSCYFVMWVMVEPGFVFCLVSRLLTVYTLVVVLIYVGSVFWIINSVVIIFGVIVYLV